MSAAAAALAVFTPLPPKANGIADYAFELLGGLARDFACTVVVANDQAEAIAPPGVAVISSADYLHDPGPLASALHVYQLGNNPDHAYMLPFMAERPGLVVLHDPSLHDLLDGVSARIGDIARYADALEAEHGVAGRMLGEQFRRYGLRERRMFLDMPMIRGVAAPSRGVIVHSCFAATKVLARAPEAAVTVAPHPYSPPRPEELEDPQAVRRALGVGEDEILFLSLGFMTRAKRIDAVLRALALARDRLPRFKYVIAGETNERELDVRGMADALGLAAAVVTLDYVDERRFLSLIPTADVVINLRYPVIGETSGTMIRALGGGACVVVVDRGPFAEIPHDAALRLAWGPDFEPRLAEALTRLAADRGLRRRLGEGARAFIAAHHRPEQTLAAYQRAIAAAQATAPPPWASDARFEFLPPHRLAETVRAARAALGRGALPLWFETGAVPVCSGAQPRTLVVGAAGAELLDRLGYRLAAGGTRRLASLDPEGAAEPARGADLAIVLPDGTAAGDPDAALARLNRLLAFGGMLVWHLALAGGEGAGPLAAYGDARRLFEAHGFRVDAAFAARPPFIDDVDDAPNDAATPLERCWRLFKVSDTYSPLALRPA